MHLSLLLARDLVGAAVPEEALEHLEPEGLDGETREWAVGEVFTDGVPGPEREFSPFFWQLWKKGPVREKLGNLRRLLFPSRETLSQTYPVPAGSRTAPLLYGLRTAQHFGDYAGVTWRLITGDESARRTADEVNRAIAMRDRLTSR